MKFEKLWLLLITLGVACTVTPEFQGGDWDSDGVPVDEDCDDEDGNSTVVADDADCDGVQTSADCDDGDSSSTVVADDGDCDGVLTSADCDDGDASSTVVADDGDCDGVVTAADCDDADPSSTVVADDGDCDGVLTAADCDDGDPSTVNDMDCDGVVTAADCDDGDSSSSVVADDGDCDGVLTAADCDDGDPSTVNDMDCDGVLTADDCDDADAGVGDTGTNLATDGDCDGVLTSADCDDGDPSLGVLCGVVLSSGTFEMGCTAGQSSCGSDESPVHTVTLSRDFWMGETEVTQGQWQALMGNNPSYFRFCGTDCPVETVNWWEALSFANAMSSAEGLAECYTLSGCTNTPGNDMECSSVTTTSTSGSPYDCTGYRLPTEAEWEYAARAGTDLLYSGSNSLDDVAWYSWNSSSTTHRVATKAANAWGLYDMSGNVYEWTWDWYVSGYYSSSPSANPEGPPSSTWGSYRVDRGGCWYSLASASRVAVRTSIDPGVQPGQGGVGFRLSRTVP